MQQEHYFDYNATAPLAPVAEAAWLEASKAQWQNPSSPYRSAARVHWLLKACREKLAHWLECDPDLIVFNSGATEGNFSLIQYLRTVMPTGAVLVSSIEHPSVIEPVKHIFRADCQLIPVDAQGVVQMAALEKQIAGKGFVSVMAANNETGSIQPIRAISKLCRDTGVIYHVDATQGLGKMPVSVLNQADFITGCAHKLGGPKGVGFLKLSASYTGYFSQKGGSQENDHRAGTEDYPGIASMIAVFEARLNHMESTVAQWKAGRALLCKKISSAIPKLRIVGQEQDTLANTLGLIMPAHRNTRWVAQLDKLGFAISTGSACATGKAGTSHVLAAMGMTPDESARSIRISAGWETHESAWNLLADAMITVWNHLEREQRNS